MERAKGSAAYYTFNEQAAPIEEARHERHAAQSYIKPIDVACVIGVVLAIAIAIWGAGMMYQAGFEAGLNQAKQVQHV